MKKIIQIMFIIILSLVIVGCSNNVNSMVVNNDGEKEKFTYEELLKIYYENKKVFDKKYKGAKISLNVTIDRITTWKDSVSKTVYYDDQGIYFGNVNIILTKEGWAILLINPSEKDYDLSKYNSGDKLKISSLISGNSVKIDDKEYLVISRKKDILDHSNENQAKIEKIT